MFRNNKRRAHAFLRRLAKDFAYGSERLAWFWMSV